MAMAIIVDLIVIGIMGLTTFIGYKRGLIKVAIKLCTFVIAIVLAIILYKPVAQLIMNTTSIDETIENSITKKILPEGDAETVSAENLKSNLPNIILKNSENTIKSVAHELTKAIIEAACMLLIFILAKIILKFITALADLIAKLPILKQFNEIGGLIYGVLEGAVIIFVGFAIISFASPMISPSIIGAINDSYIGSLCYNHNILLGLIM